MLRLAARRPFRFLIVLYLRKEAIEYMMIALDFAERRDVIEGERRHLRWHGTMSGVRGCRARRRCRVGVP